MINIYEAKTIKWEMDNGSHISFFIFFIFFLFLTFLPSFLAILNRLYIYEACIYNFFNNSFYVKRFSLSHGFGLDFDIKIIKSTSLFWWRTICQLGHLCIISESLSQLEVTLQVHLKFNFHNHGTHLNQFFLLTVLTVMTRCFQFRYCLLTSQKERF